MFSFAPFSQYTVDYVGGSTSGSLDSSNPAYKGGTIILATGIIGIFIFLVSMVLLLVAHRRSISNYRYGALLGLYLSSGLLVLGIVLYAHELNAGYSFILMTIAGFCYFIGVGLLVISGMASGTDSSSSSSSDPNFKSMGGM